MREMPFYRTIQLQAKLAAPNTCFARQRNTRYASLQEPVFDTHQLSFYLGRVR